MNTQINCISCGYGAKTYEGTNEIRRILIELNWFELLPLNGITQILRPCPKCSEKKLIKA
jgi:hypothetical protein